MLIATLSGSRPRAYAGQARFASAQAAPAIAAGDGPRGRRLLGSRGIAVLCDLAERARKSGEMRIYLETERLLLREFTELDVDNLRELDSDPEVMRFINGGVATPRDLIRRKILPWFMSFYGRPQAVGFWAAHEKASGDFIGWFCLHPEEGRDPGELALGYRLSKAFWRKGYGSEGAGALIDKAFRELGARRVFACTYSENLASRGVMETCGMRHARSYRMAGAELDDPMTYMATNAVFPADDVEYAVDRTDWEARRSAR